MSDPNDSTSTGDSTPLSSTFLELCAKVRKDDPSILPEPGQPFKIRALSEKEDIELSNALLENINGTYLELRTEEYTKVHAEAMAKYVRTSKQLRRINWRKRLMADAGEYEQREETFCCFLPAFQESTSLKELHIDFPIIGGSSNLALKNMLTQTQSLRSLSLLCPEGLLEDIAVVPAASGLKKNTTLRKLALEYSRYVTALFPILTSLYNHPLLQRLCLCRNVVDLTGLETLLLSATSKITELDICKSFAGPPMMGLTRVLRALAHRPRLTELGLRYTPFGRDDARLLGIVLCNTTSLHTLALERIRGLRSAGLAELAPALYRSTPIKVLDMSNNQLDNMASVELLRDILCHNKTITTLDFSGNAFGEITGVVECIVDGLGSNSMLKELDLTCCSLRDGGVSTLERTLGSRNMTLQKLALGYGRWRASRSNGT